jgi:hypothetical protein
MGTQYVLWEGGMHGIDAKSTGSSACITTGCDPPSEVPLSEYILDGCSLAYNKYEEILHTLVRTPSLLHPGCNGSWTDDTSEDGFDGWSITRTTVRPRTG